MVLRSKHDLIFISNMHIILKQKLGKVKLLLIKVVPTTILQSNILHVKKLCVHRP